MCGRFNLTASDQEIFEHFALRRIPRHEVSYNITPGQKILAIVLLDDGSYKSVYLHWGLIPSWSKDSKIADRLINARAETVAEKPSFRSAYKKRRCLVAASGFYEWQQRETSKQPYHIHRPDNALFAFAGLWEHWDHQSETSYSCTIITTAANALMQPVHQRMPVIVAPENYHPWLDKQSEPAELRRILSIDAYADFRLTAISTRINNPQHNDVNCLR